MIKVIKNIKKQCVLILFCMLIFCSNRVYAAETNEEFTNIVLFVDFTDTTVHNHTDVINADACFKKTGNGDITLRLFDGVDSKGNVDKRGLTPYISAISYGQLSVNNIFPQYDEGTNTIEPYILDKDAAYYKDKPFELVQDLMKKLDEDTVGKTRIGNSKLSHRTNGTLDNLIIVTGWSGSYFDDPLSGITYRLGGGSFTANSGITYTVDSFNIVPEGGAYLGIKGSGLIIHEFMHSLGYPDLYCNPESNGITSVPVGIWDIMASAGSRVQFPLAYTRQYISGWLQLNTVTTNQSGYQLVAAAAANSSNKNQQAVILKTPYSDTEFFVVEYRKKMNVDYETNLPSSGLIIYRIDTKRRTNINGAPYIVYVYRTGDTVGNTGYENGNTQTIYLEGSCMSKETGITSYGNTDLSAGLEKGAITYSDGTNSGIVIKNIGSSYGDTISFDIEFNNMSQNDNWTIVSDGKIDSFTQETSSCMDENGTMYCISSSGSTSYLLQNISGNWSKITSVPLGYSYSLVKYNGYFYVAYINKNGYLTLIRYVSNQWDDVYVSNTKVTEYNMQLGKQGLHLVFNGENYSGVYDYYYNGNDGNLSIIEAPSSVWSANPQVIFSGEIPYVAYREALNNNKIIIKRLINGIWEDVPNDFCGETFNLSGNSNMIYLTLQESAGIMVYALNTEENSDWILQGTQAVSTERLSSCDYTFISEQPYIALTYATYAEVLTLQNNIWKRVGNKFSLTTINDLAFYNYNNGLYVTYRNALDNSVVIKKYIIEDKGSSGEKPKPEEPKPEEPKPEEPKPEEPKPEEPKPEEPKPDNPPSVLPDVEEQTQVMYRLYNPNSGEHFYTAVMEEKDYLVKVGWNYEGIAWYAPVTGNPVYRLYNPNAGDHHYTTSVSEKNHLVNVGWNDEGVAWYSGGSTPLYRSYNPNAIAGAHHYTTSKGEINHLVSVGWKDEGIGWYGVK